MKEKAERNARIVELWRTGNYTLRDLAEMFNLSPTTVYHICRGHKMNARRDSRSPLQARNDEIIRLRESGLWNYRMLAEKYGLSRARIEQICRAGGVKRERPVSRYDRFLKNKEWMLAHRFDPTEEIAKITGAAENTIYIAFRALGIYRPKNIRAICNIKERLEQMGIPCKIIGTRYRTLLEVNGKKVALLCLHKTGMKSKYPVFQFLLDRVGEDIEYGILSRPGSDDLYVLPLKEIDQKSISFSANPIHAGWSPIHKYKNNLELLRTL